MFPVSSPTPKQDRLDRAAKTCQDNVRDKMSSDTSTVDRAKYQKQYEDCVSKKVDEHLANLPALIKKVSYVVVKLLSIVFDSHRPVILTLAYSK